MRDLLNHDIQVKLSTDVSEEWNLNILIAIKKIAMMIQIIITLERDSRIRKREHQNDETIDSSSKADQDQSLRAKKVKYEEMSILDHRPRNTSVRA
jgi:hypothetical protein